MSNRTAYRTLDEVEIAARPDVTEIEVTLSYYWENDGIGPYEYWGAKGFDHGHDYVVIEDYSYDKEGLTADEIATIDSMIEKMLDTWAESIAEDDCEDDYEPDDDCEPDSHFYEFYEN